MEELEGTAPDCFPAGWIRQEAHALHHFWPVSGLAGIAVVPSHACAQWLGDGWRGIRGNLLTVAGAAHLEPIREDRLRVSRLTAHKSMCAGTRSLKLYMAGRWREPCLGGQPGGAARDKPASPQYAFVSSKERSAHSKWAERP